MPLLKRLTIAAAGIMTLLVIGCHSYSATPQQSEEPSKSHKLTLTWNKAPRAKSYNVYRRPYRTGTYTKLGNSNTTAYEDATVQSAERYCYQVTSVDAKGQEGERSREFCVTIPHP
jgi:fibronectin type 3 domain-containing protein